VSRALREQAKPRLSQSRINPYHYLARDVEGCYLFNEGGGNIVNDISGNLHHILICLNSSAPSLRERTFMNWEGLGHFGDGCLRGKPHGNSFVGVGNVLTPYFKKIFTPGQDAIQCSFEAWINVGADLDPFGAILSGANASSNVGFYVNQLSTGWQFDWRDITATAHTGGGLLRVNQWYHVAASIYRQRTELYVNGLPYLTIVPSATSQPMDWIWAFNDGGGASNTFVGLIDFMAVYKRALASQEIMQRYNSPFDYVLPMSRPPRVSLPASTITVSPAKMQWRAQTVSASTPTQGFAITPAKMQWQANRLSRSFGTTTVALTPGTIEVYANNLNVSKRNDINLSPAAISIRANDIPSPGRVFRVQPARMKYSANSNRAIVGPVARDCSAGLAAILAPALGLKQSFHFDTFDGTWGHNMVDISDIEISVPPGGGLASVNNVTVRLAERNTGPTSPFDTIAGLWERAKTLESVTCTIDFLADGQSDALRIMTGHIDTITVQDAVTSLLIVDDSISKNIMIPQKLFSTDAFSQADSRIATQPEPLIYGHGSRIGAAPLALVDIPNNVYMLAAHPMQIGGNLAMYVSPAATFVTVPTAIPVSNDNVQASITLGTVDTAVMTLAEQSVGNTSAENCVDSISNTLALIGTAVTDSNVTDGVGWIGVTPGVTGYPTTGTIQVSITNHRRSPGSDPTTNGTFYVRTIDPTSGGVMRNLLTVGPFNHTTSLQNNVYQISNVQIGINETIEVLALARCQGTIGSTSQTYEVGEISITPMVVFSANTSGNITAVAVPRAIQELRFNETSYPLVVAYENFVDNAAAAIDGISNTLAYLRTSGTDSNLDGIGELMVVAAAGSTSAQRANNTAVVNFVNHRRGVNSDPTVTGTFSIRTVGSNGQILRDNLANYGPFRQQLNPLTTSYTAAAINLGYGEQLGIRLVARNEGGPGNSDQKYEVGEISFETFYQTTGDSTNVALLATSASEYTGRYDPDGSISRYNGLTSGAIFNTPDQIMASILLQEIGIPIDEAWFATAYTFFAGWGFFFDGGIGLDWPVQRQDARALIGDLARFSTSIVLPTFAAQWGIRPFRDTVDPRQSFDTSNILLADGAENQRPEEWQSTFQLTLGNLQSVYNHFEVHYHYNIGSRQYDKVYTINPETNEFVPGTVLDGDILNGKCKQSFARFGVLAPMIVQANWIADDHAAQILLRHLVNYFSDQRIFVEFDTTNVAACLQVGDFITVTYPSIPLADNGQVYEIHSMKYMPAKGRIHITASRRTTANVTFQVSPAQMVMKASREILVGRNQITVSPAKMKWVAADGTAIIGTNAYGEGWEYTDTLSNSTTFSEGWTAA
jgi:Concanavalin A-like lectin/glucanases superfamily